MGGVSFDDVIIDSPSKTIISCGIPFVMFPGNGSTVGLQFTGSAGAFTLSASAIPTNHYALLSGFYTYLPANFGGQTIDAGWYWATLSSDTAGILYQNTYTSGTPTIPATPTAFVANLTGWLTQSLSEITALNGFTLFGGSLGKNGDLTWWWRLGGNTSGSKAIKIKLGGTTLMNIPVSTSPGVEASGKIKNIGRQDKQIISRYSSLTGIGQAGATYSANEVSSIDTSSDKTITVTLLLQTTSDALALMAFTLISTYGE